MNLPIYYFKVDENDSSVGLTAIAMVDKPAILAQWMAFDEHKKREPMKFAVNEERRIVTSPILIPDLPIYRKMKDETGIEKEFYVAASKQTIEHLVKKFMRDRLTDNIKATHSQESDKTKGVYMFEMFIADESRGIQQPKGMDYPDGTAFASISIENDQEWAKVKSGDYNGLSIEIFAPMEKAPIELTEQEIQAVINAII